MLTPDGERACEVCYSKYAHPPPHITVVELPEHLEKERVTLDYYICRSCLCEGKRAACIDCVVVRRFYTWREIFKEPAYRPKCPKCGAALSDRHTARAGEG